MRGISENALAHLPAKEQPCFGVLLGPLVSRGTCFFVYVAVDCAVAAIDSRKNTPAGHDDTACKITCLDDSTVFLCQGIVEGWGSHFHVSNSLFAELRAFLRKRKHKYVDGHRFGQALNWRLRTMGVAFDTLGFKPNLLRRGHRETAHL